ncbi:MAG: response regulator [Rhodocyclaceae bacterium]|nr:response regulator [Rhodocyclaceae bacterium]
MELFDFDSDTAPEAAAPEDEAPRLSAGAGFATLIVDDDPVARMILTDQFEDLGLRSLEAESGEECLARLDEDVGVVLLDVNMAGLNGIETCARLRAEGHRRCQVIFISADGEIDTRLSAYDAGGNDFIVKPVDPDELERKLRVAQRALAEFDTVSGEAANARQAAFAAMSSMGEMGTVLEFMRRSFACGSNEELARAILDTTSQYQLSGLVEIGGPDGRRGFNANGPCSPLEHSILEHSRDLQRIFQFSNRMVINYPTVTLVVSGLPVDDPDFVGRLRDHLAVLAEAADARARAIAVERERDRHATAVLDAVHHLDEVIAEVERRHAGNRARASQISSEFLSRMEAAFVHMGLTELQETDLVELATQATRGIADLQGDMLAIQEQLSEALATLRRAAN